MEVMGLMLGEFVDDYTVRVIDVFAMPQSGTVSLQLAVLQDNIKIFHQNRKINHVKYAQISPCSTPV